MTHATDPAFDQRVADWLEGDPNAAPDAVLDTVLAAFPSIPQRRRGLGLPGWRTRTATSILKLAFGAAATLAIVIGGLSVMSPRGSPGVGGPSASPTPPPIPGRLAFDRTVDGNSDVYVVSGDGTGLTRITTDPADDADPAWSPDGASLAFVRDGDIFVITVDGGVATRVTTSPEEDRGPAFSPDGTSLAFSRGNELWLVGIDGALPRRVLPADAFVCCPAWTPDGLGLLFNRDTTPGGGIEILRLDLQGGEVTRLSDRADGEDSSFALSPDGRTIAYQSDAEPGGLFAMRADGTGIRHVFGGWKSGSSIAWTPDNRWISFVSADWIYLIAPDGSGFSEFVSGRNPDWTRGQP